MVIRDRAALPGNECEASTHATRRVKRGSAVEFSATITRNSVDRVRLRPVGVFWPDCRPVMRLYYNTALGNGSSAESQISRITETRRKRTPSQWHLPA